MIIDAELRAAAGARVGDRLEVAIAPTTGPRALAIAKQQAQLTTAPRKRARSAGARRLRVSR